MIQPEAAPTDHFLEQVVHGSTRRAALWAAPALLSWQPEVRVAAHHVTAALHVLNVVG